MVWCLSGVFEDVNPELILHIRIPYFDRSGEMGQTVGLLSGDKIVLFH